MTSNCNCPTVPTIFAVVELVDEELRNTLIHKLFEALLELL